jgi:hypothetical protein
MISVHSRTILSLLAGATAVTVAVLMTGTAPDALTTSSCAPTKLHYMASDTSASTSTSANFVSVPEAAITFTQGGSTKSCVVVRFSAETFEFEDGGIRIKATLDNTTVAVPPEVNYSAGDRGTAGAHAFDFIFPLVAPGSHTVRIQFRSGGNPGTARVQHHTTIVQHAP